MLMHPLPLTRPANKQMGPSHSNQRAIRFSNPCELSDCLRKYTLRDRLGKGSYGDVYLAETKISGVRTHLAIKVINRSKLKKESTRALLLTEIQNLKHLTLRASPFFTLLHETFLDAHNYYIVTDYLRGGTLREELNLRRSMTADRILLITAQLVVALGHLHDARIIHRDLKPENVLLDALGNVTIADLGLSRRFSPGQKSMRPVTIETTKGQIIADTKLKYMTSSTCGTLAYVSPEMFRGEPYSFKVDIYALGVILYEMLFDALPYSQESMKEVANAACRGAWNVPDNLEVHPVAYDLLIVLLCPYPQHRIDLVNLMSHPFFERVDWETLAARAYELPMHHAPILAAHNRTRSINPRVLLDPVASVPDNWDLTNPCISDIDASFTIEPPENRSALLTRPKDPRRWNYRMRRMIRAVTDNGGIFNRIRRVANCVTGHKAHIVQHKWSSIGCEQFVKYKAGLDAVKSLQLALRSDRNSRLVCEREQLATMSISGRFLGNENESRRIGNCPILDDTDALGKREANAAFSLFNCSIDAVPMHANSGILRSVKRTSSEERRQSSINSLGKSVHIEQPSPTIPSQERTSTASVSIGAPVRPSLALMRKAKSNDRPRRPRPALRRIVTDLPVACDSLACLDSKTSFDLDHIFDGQLPALSLQSVQAEGIELKEISQLLDSFLIDRSRSKLSEDIPPSLAASTSVSATNSTLPSSGPLTPLSSVSRASDARIASQLKTRYSRPAVYNPGDLEGDFTACISGRV